MYSVRQNRAPTPPLPRWDSGKDSIGPEGRPKYAFGVNNNPRMDREALAAIIEKAFGGDITKMAVALKWEESEIPSRASEIKSALANVPRPIASNLEHRLNVHFFGEKYPGASLHQGNPDKPKWTTPRYSESDRPGSSYPYLGDHLLSHHVEAPVVPKASLEGADFDQVFGSAPAAQPKPQDKQINALKKLENQIEKGSDQLERKEISFIPSQAKQDRFTKLEERMIRDEFRAWIQEQWQADIVHNPNKREPGGVGYIEKDSSGRPIKVVWLWRGWGDAESVKIPTKGLMGKENAFQIHGHPPGSEAPSIRDFSNSANRGAKGIKSYLITGENFYQIHSEEVEFTRLVDRGAPIPKTLVGAELSHKFPWQFDPGPKQADLMGGKFLTEKGIFSPDGNPIALRHPSGLFRSWKSHYQLPILPDGSLYTSHLGSPEKIRATEKDGLYTIVDERDVPTFHGTKFLRSPNGVGELLFGSITPESSLWDLVGS